MLRSVLFVPAKLKYLEKIVNMEADAFVVDLEDSIEEENKEAALKLLLEKLPDFLLRRLFVRLNKDRFIHEATMLNKFSVGFMLPKFECIEEYGQCADIWDNHSVIALVETPKGIINLELISKCDWVDGLAFGAEDYTATVGMINHYSSLYFQKTMIVTYAKANGKFALDTPSFLLEVNDELKKEIENAVELGFDGKLAINPKQIRSINEAFEAYDIEYIKKVISVYEEKNEAVLVYEGKVYEKMHIEHLKRIIKEHQ